MNFLEEMETKRVDLRVNGIKTEKMKMNGKDVVFVIEKKQLEKIEGFTYVRGEMSNKGKQKDVEEIT